MNQLLVPSGDVPIEALLDKVENGTLLKSTAGMGPLLAAIPFIEEAQTKDHIRPKNELGFITKRSTFAGACIGK